MAKYQWTYNGTSRMMSMGRVSFDETKMIGVTQYNAVYDGHTFSVYTFGMSTADGSTISMPVVTWSTSENLGDVNTYTTWTSDKISMHLKAFSMTSPRYTEIIMTDLMIDNVVFRIGGTRPQVGMGTSIDIDYTLGLSGYKGTFRGISGIFIAWNKSIWTHGSEYIKGDSGSNVSWLFIPLDVLNYAEAKEPYDGADTENNDGTPDGGYAEGSANIGTVTPGTVPIHPLSSSSVGIHVYRLGGSALASFVGKMWGAGGGTVFEDLWSKWKNYKFNPMAGIISCHALPSEFMPTGAVSNAVSIAGTTISDIAGQSTGGQVIEQRYTADMTAYFHWNNFLDYTNAVFIAHVPFCGECEIPAVNCVGGSVLFVYRCDIMTGNVACWICPTDSRGNTQQTACLTGNCAYILPVTGNDNGMGEIIGAVKTSIGNALQYHYGANMSANMGGIGAGLNAGYSGSMSARPALDILTARSNTQVAGNLAGSVALVANNHLFLDVKFANPSYPDYMLTARGTASDTGGLVSKFTGHYVEFADVHADGIAGATREEKAMIENALLSGVYV